MKIIKNHPATSSETLRESKQEGLLAGLNEKQREAAMTTEGPVLVIAGAGSGKTRLLTYRVAYLIKERGISPRNVLAVTFTNKASQEMKERIRKIMGGKLSLEPTVGTFHSVCVQILRREIKRIGFSGNFVIFDGQDQLALIKKVMKEKNVNSDKFNPRAILSVISRAKNDLESVKHFIRGESLFEEIIAKVYDGYQNSLNAANALDFDDILVYTVEIFRKFPEVLEKYQSIFKYILVDEYQDTNKAQYVLVNMLAELHRNLCVVGDDWQSIYSFRGADIKNILDFEKDYPEAVVIRLERNYRSTQKILDAAYGIISQNIHRKDKKLWTDIKGDHQVVVYEASDEMDEADFVVSQAQNIRREDNLKLSDFVVLYRTNAQSRAIEEGFLKAALPYRIVGGLKFYERKEIKDFLAYLRLVANPKDSLSLERIVNSPPRGIGQVTLKKWVDFTREQGTSFIESAKDAEKIEGLAAAKIDAIKKFNHFIERAQEKIKKASLTDFFDYIFLESGFQTFLLSEGEAGQIRFENVRELFTVAEKYDELNGEEGLTGFLEEVALVSQSDDIDQKKDAVHLMTLHNAKGLEFNTVFMVGMEEGLFPHSRSLIDPSELEEERRLCYVGVTRAKSRVFLSHASSRNIYGSVRVNVPSRFIENIPQDLIKNANNEHRYEKFRKDKKSKSVSKYNDGERVNHDKFGEGIVVSAEGDVLTVAFRKVGIKKISSAYAHLRKA
ncbi:MAG: UvrD-helicase domain-containing protein [Parcubacteria group bacterium]|jgi:DNA helicase-2/ATP-dependent DNA helicase PcrA